MPTKPLTSGDRALDSIARIQLAVRRAAGRPRHGGYIGQVDALAGARGCV